MVSVLCPALKVEIIQYAPRANWKEMEYHVVTFLSESLSEKDFSLPSPWTESMCNGSGHKSVTCVVSGIPPRKEAQTEP